MICDDDDDDTFNNEFLNRNFKYVWIYLIYAYCYIYFINLTLNVNDKVDTWELLTVISHLFVSLCILIAFNIALRYSHNYFHNFHNQRKCSLVSRQRIVTSSHFPSETLCRHAASCWRASGLRTKRWGTEDDHSGSNNTARRCVREHQWLCERHSLLCLPIP